MSSPFSIYKNVKHVENFITTDGTQQTVFSIPLPISSSVIVDIQVLGQVTTGNVQVVIANFQSFAYRNATGNIAKAGSSFSDTKTGVNAVSTTTFDATTTGVVKTVANTSTQSLNLVVIGKTGITIKWDCLIKYLIRSN